MSARFNASSMIKGMPDEVDRRFPVSQLVEVTVEVDKESVNQPDSTRVEAVHGAIRGSCRRHRAATSALVDKCDFPTYH